MVWRGPERRPEGRAALRARVEAATPIGLLGYLDGEPVAWCSIAPKATYLDRLGGRPPETGENVWSLVCFYVARQHRGRGISDQMLRAAVDHATRQGADIVEAYPVDPSSPSYRFMGFRPAFERAGFVEVGRAGSRRYVMRLRVPAG